MKEIIKTGFILIFIIISDMAFSKEPIQDFQYIINHECINYSDDNKLEGYDKFIKYGIPVFFGLNFNPCHSENDIISGFTIKL